MYKECLARLQLIQDAFGILQNDDEDELQELSNQLSKLSELIGRVERSRIEEFSWPFALALQDLAVKICKSPDEDASTPLFFISADDELNSYSIITEQSTAGFINSPLFNIIFPRSLKHFVLLHPILGHELGHAAIAAPHHTDKLQKDVIAPLVQGSPLQELPAFERWLVQVDAGFDIDTATQALWSWTEELYCDLFGLLLMGPSYIGANSSLLRPFKSYTASASHPPSATRYWVIQQAVDLLGWRDEIGRHRKLRKPSDSYFDSLSSLALKVPRKYRLLKRKQIRIATTALQAFLAPVSDALFRMPNTDSIASMCAMMMNACPPVSTSISSNLDHVENSATDFRSILLAGWLTWVHDQRRAEELTFMKLNLLCHRGVLQQSAVDVWINYQQRIASSVGAELTQGS